MTTLEKLQEMLASEYGIPQQEIQPEVELDSFGVDSLGMMELLFNIEKTFGIVIPNEQVELRTVGQVATYIDKLADEQQVSVPAS
ncbi:MAG TPA: acyl carrier protein [Methylophilaceae bacterium]|nr:acyl carrier protein [Methylophilaceae bacterium]